MRRLFLGLVAALLLFPATLLSAVAAQTPSSAAGSPFADLGLPELKITASADSYDGIPSSLEAGRYLVTVTAADDTAGAGGAGVAFVQPAGMTGQEFIDFLGQMSAGPDSGASTPMAGDMATPSDQGGPMGAPDFYYQSTMPGGTFSPAGTTTQAVVDLTPGDWVAWGDDPTSTQAPVAFTVTGEMPTNLPEPQADVVITLGEYVIKVTEGQLTGGPQVVRIDNIGAQPHFIFGTVGPAGLTDADVEAILNADMTGTPAANVPNPETDFQDVFGTATQSAGTTQWIAIDSIPSGSLVMLCFAPDEGDGMPHAMHGMYAIVPIGE